MVFISWRLPDDLGGITCMPIEFSLYFQNYLRHLNQNFREVRKIYEMGLRSKIMRVNLFYKVPSTFEHSHPYFQKSQKSID